MDLNNIKNRLMMLECLRENATNMRIEQQNLRERISQALLRSRVSLITIRELNIELQEMKSTVENALVTDLQELAAIASADVGQETVDETPEEITDANPAELDSMPVDLNEGIDKQQCE